MNRLFWKIFLSFWMAVGLMTSIVIATNIIIFNINDSATHQLVKSDTPGSVIQGASAAPNRNVGWFKQSNRNLAVGVLLALLVSAIVCAVLARYITRPIQQMREAGQQIAGGNLSARVGQSITGRADEFGDLGRDFDQMANRVEELLKTQQRLLRDVSHELRSPLARLQAAVGLARQGASDGVVEALDRADNETVKLSELIDQIMSYARLETFSSIDKQRTDVHDLLVSIVDDTDFEAQASNRHVAYSGCKKLIMNLDGELMRSAIENVVRNALRYAPEGSAIEMHTHLGDSLTIEICDSGPGVPESTLQSLFEPFYRVDHAREKISGGSGVGLAIAASAVRLHGGTIRATNRLDNGLAVTICLPFDDETEYA